MKTAVERLVEELSKKSKAMKIMFNAYKEIVEQSKSMEEEQTIHFAKGWMWENHLSDKPINIEQYYNETFKQQEQ